MARNQKTWTERMVERKPDLYWWTLAIIVCVCMAVISWVFVPAVFNNPEKPENYKILEKINRLPKIKKFSALAPPEGDIVTTDKLYNVFANLPKKKVETLNKRLLKNYIGNFKYEYFNAYIKGDFRVIECRPLTKDDVFMEGIAIKAVALIKKSQYSKLREFPVWIEIILPNAPAEAAKHTKKGDLIEIRKNPYFASILNIRRLEREDNDPIMYFTIIPLVYESTWDPAHGPKFNISPPEKLNIDAKFPIFN